MAAVACLAAPAASQPLEEVLEFEELEPLCVASSTVGDYGSGPVRIRGTSRRFGERTNAAVVVDTAHPRQEAGLQTADRHNALYISRIPPHKPAGAEAAWVQGSVGEVDDDDIPGGVVSFDFREIGPVTFYGLTLIDHDNRTAKIRLHREDGAAALLPEIDPSARPYLTWGGGGLRSKWRRARLEVPRDEAPWHQLEVAPVRYSGTLLQFDVRELRAADRAAKALLGRGEILDRGVPDVVQVDVQLGGSSALDRIVFRRQRETLPDDDEDMFSKLEDRIADSVRPELEQIRTDFYTGWREIVDHPPVHREDLERLIGELETRLLGQRALAEPNGRGLLQCPDLPCGCPELRGLRAWVEEKVASIRSGLEAAAESEAVGSVSRPDTVRIASMAPGAYLDAASPIEVQERDEVDCDGTFWEQFFCDGQGLLNGVSGAIASLLRPKVRFGPDDVLVAGVARSCQEYRVAPMSADYGHAETAVLPSESRRLPRGLYCVHCRTPDGVLRPFATLDLVEGGEAGPVKGQDQRCSNRG